MQAWPRLKKKDVEGIALLRLGSLLGGEQSRLRSPYVVLCMFVLVTVMPLAISQDSNEARWRRVRHHGVRER